jgi:formylglycine-generating enzyme required for sulfatase activity
MNGGNNNNSVQLLLEELTRLLPGQFEVLLVNLNAPVQYLPPRDAAQAVRAAELVRWVENSKALDRLEVELNRFRPQPPPVAGIPPEPKVVPPTPQPKTFVNSIGMEFVLVPAGEFLMGGDKKDNEKPIHKVTIGSPFYLGKYQVTQGEWKAVMAENPSKYKSSGRLPVENVSWNDCQEFIAKLNEREKGVTYRLPSEAEWEYACRAGTTGYYAGNLDEMAWYSKGLLSLFDFSGCHPVGLKQANAFGLYDMHGNVWEWCQDRWHENYNGAPMDGSAWETGEGGRILRGGSWSSVAVSCRSALRSGLEPDSRSNFVGFRCVLRSART